MNGVEIKEPDVIKRVYYDFIIIAMGSKGVEVLEQLYSYGVPMQKILYSYNPSMLPYCTTPLDKLFVIPKKAYDVKFKKIPAEIYCDDKGETYKSHNRRERGIL